MALWEVSIARTGCGETGALRFHHGFPGANFENKPSFVMPSSAESEFAVRGPGGSWRASRPTERPNAPSSGSSSVVSEDRAYRALSLGAESRAAGLGADPHGVAQPMTLTIPLGPCDLGPKCALRWGDLVVSSLAEVWRCAHRAAAARACCNLHGAGAPPPTAPW